LAYCQQRVVIPVRCQVGAVFAAEAACSYSWGSVLAHTHRCLEVRSIPDIGEDALADCCGAPGRPKPASSDNRKVSWAAFDVSAVVSSSWDVSSVVDLEDQAAIIGIR